MSQSLCCSACNEIILKSVSDGSIKLRSKVLIFKDDGAYAICKGCDTEVPVPVVADMNLVKSIVGTKKLRLYIKE